MKQCTLPENVEIHGGRSVGSARKPFWLKPLRKHVIEVSSVFPWL